jgi:hypothetical protein
VISGSVTVQVQKVVLNALPQGLTCKLARSTDIGDDALAQQSLLSSDLHIKFCLVSKTYLKNSKIQDRIL